MQPVDRPHSAHSAQHLSKLRKAAKVRVRSGESTSHSHALDAVAADAGFPHWKAVVRALGDPSPDGPQLASPSCTILHGVSGSGKTTRAQHIARDQLRRGRSVVIIDCAESYRSLAQVHLAAVVRLERRQDLPVLERGALLLMEYESASFGAAHARQLPRQFAEECGLGKDFLLLIDEMEHAHMQFDGASDGIAAHVANGGSALLVMQSGPGSDLYEHYAACAPCA